jgi:hypothetical protein
MMPSAINAPWLSSSELTWICVVESGSVLSSLGDSPSGVEDPAMDVRQLQSIRFVGTDGFESSEDLGKPDHVLIEGVFELW